jgi:hypothetical protein
VQAVQQLALDHAIDLPRRESDVPELPPSDVPPLPMRHLCGARLTKSPVVVEFVRHAAIVATAA